MIRALINLYCLLVLIDFIISYIPAWQGLKWVEQLHAIADYSLKPIRRYIRPLRLSRDLVIDASPFVFFFLTRLVFWLW